MEVKEQNKHKIQIRSVTLGNLNNYVGINTLWTGDADLRLYITTVQDGWCTSAFLKRAWFPRTIHCLVPLHKGECFQRYHTLQHN